MTRQLALSTIPNEDYIEITESMPCTQSRKNKNDKTGSGENCYTMLGTMISNNIKEDLCFC